MTRDLPFIAGAYTIGIAVPLAYALAATMRAARARRRLAAAEAVRR